MSCEIHVYLNIGLSKTNKFVFSAVDLDDGTPPGQMIDRLTLLHAKYYTEFLTAEGFDINYLINDEKGDSLGYYYVSTGQTVALKGCRVPWFGVFFVMLGAIDWTNHPKLMIDFIIYGFECPNPEFAAYNFFVSACLGSVLSSPVSLYLFISDDCNVHLTSKFLVFTPELRNFTYASKQKAHSYNDFDHYKERSF